MEFTFLKSNYFALSVNFPKNLSQREVQTISVLFPIISKFKNLLNFYMEDEDFSFSYELTF